MKMKQMAVGVALTMGVAGSYAAITTDSFGSGDNAFSINFVDIGGAGNVAEPSRGSGAVDYAYRIGQTEVTVAQFSAVFATGGDYWSDLGSDAPAAKITYHEAMQFANYLTTGDTAEGVYQFNENGTTLLSIDRAYRNAENMAYVLPTEDEWFKAAFYNSADESYSAYVDGTDSVSNVGNGGWNISDYQDGAWAVGSGAQEQNGTYDMMGNVWEWLEIDDLDNDYSGFSGGCYDSYAQPWGGSGAGTNSRFAYIGFRVAAIPEPASMALIGLFGGGVLFIRRIFMV